jgi:CubicO group peptidase (beta-lactamase class C family)
VDIAAIEKFIADELGAASIPGAAVAVTRGDEVLLVRGFGHDSTGAPVTGDTLFRIASLSKSFTALAVIQLVDADRLSIDDPVVEHLPEFQLADPRADQVTVRQLLDHTSGLTDEQVPELSRPQPSTPTEAMASLRPARLASTPGTMFSYHNPNYHVAARLVEVLSGEPFNTHLRRHVLIPAGMVSTTTTTTDDQPVPGLRRGHVIAYGHAFAAPAFGSFTVGDGGVVSTAADMARWLTVNAGDGQASDGTRLVSRQGLEQLHTPSATQSGYALGWDTVSRIDASTRLEHSGSLFTFSAYEAVWPESGCGVALLFNGGSGLLLDQTAIAHGVFDIVEGNEPGPPSANRTFWLDAVLALLTLTALILGALGMRHAGRWAKSRRRSPRRAVLRLLPSVSVLGLAAAFPWMVESALGRDVTWRALAYGWPALVTFVVAAFVAAAGTLLARSWHLLYQPSDPVTPPGERGEPTPTSPTLTNAQESPS